MHDTHAILCFGKTLPGFDPLAVRRAIQHSFKCSDAEMNEMFSGAEVRLREALSADEAELWRQQLNGLGLKVMIDPPPPADTRTPAPGMADGGSAKASAHRAPCADPDSPAVFGFGLEGRFGRAAGLRAGCYTLIAAGILLPVSMLLTDKAWGIPAATVALLLNLLTYFYPLRLTWLRCHDLGLNGAWALILLLPYCLVAVSPFRDLNPLTAAMSPSDLALASLGLGLSTALLLVGWPGQTRDNPWGPPPGCANPIPAALGALLVAGAYGAFLLSNLEPLLHFGVRFLSLPT